MEPFKTLTSLATPLDRTNVDTDQIIPKQFLKRIERTGYDVFAATRVPRPRQAMIALGQWLWPA